MKGCCRAGLYLHERLLQEKCNSMNVIKAYSFLGKTNLFIHNTAITEDKKKQ